MPVTQTTLLFGVHAHQPVGNFASVMEDAHQRCYRPFLETLFDYPDFHFCAHFSGWLLDWLRERFPHDMELLARMVERGQVEMFSAGDTEPVLAALPHRDRVGQLHSANDKLRAWTGVEPRGAWLTERVWESSVVPALAEAGMRYAMVDDYHFLCTGKQAEELGGYFSTEEGGTRLDVFPISEPLRYRIPFHPAGEVIDHLEKLAGNGQAAATYFDDIEKFGIWPETHDWVYGRGWLRAFIQGVLASPHIRTATCAQFHARQSTQGIVYLPSASYREMNEWTLPAPAASIYAQMVARGKAEGLDGLHQPFVRGGVWRNFFTRYPEGNWMHKRMLGLSRRLAQQCKPAHALTELLYRAQANDAYWHGLFGGIYLPHLRRAVWNHLIALEAQLDTLSSRPHTEEADLDLDGKAELLTHSPHWLLALRDDGLAAVHELSSYPLRHNFGDTLRRHRERYHADIDKPATAAPAEGIASAHDRVRSKHPISAADIAPDAHPRALWMDALDGAVLQDYQKVSTGMAHYQRPGIQKHYALHNALNDAAPHEAAVMVRWHFAGLAGRSFSTTLHLALPSCDGPLGRYVQANGAFLGHFGQPLRLQQATVLLLDDGLLGGVLRLETSLPATIEGHAHLTVSQSEAGFEKIMQAAALTFRWVLPSDDCTLELQLTLQERNP